MTLNIATATKLDLLVADIQGEITYTVLPTRKARKSELIMSRTQGPRTNTNRRGQAYSGHATHAQNAVVQGNAAAYFKTSGWVWELMSPWRLMNSWRGHEYGEGGAAVLV